MSLSKLKGNKEMGRVHEGGRRWEDDEKYKRARTRWPEPQLHQIGTRNSPRRRSTRRSGEYLACTQDNTNSMERNESGNDTYQSREKITVRQRLETNQLNQLYVKIGEKVVASRLQEAGLLHPLQFGSVKGRSAMDAAVKKAQWTLASEEGLGQCWKTLKGHPTPPNARGC